MGMASDFGTKVAQRIRDLRAARGLSVRELARRSGIAPESVSRSERAINEITLTNLEKVCSGLGVSLPTFFSFADDGAAGRVPPDVARVVGLLLHLPPAGRRSAARGLGLLLAGAVGSVPGPKPRRARPTPAR